MREATDGDGFLAAAGTAGDEAFPPLLGVGGSLLAEDGTECALVGTNAAVPWLLRLLPSCPDWNVGCVVVPVHDPQSVSFLAADVRVMEGVRPM